MHSFNTMLTKNRDNTYDLVIAVYPDFSAEFARELFAPLRESLVNKKIRTVKIVIAGLVAVSIPFSCFMADKGRYSMSYVYFGSQSTQLEYIALAKDSLNTVSPSYFDIEADGNIKVNYISQSFVDKVHNMGLKVVPFLSNHWNRSAGVAALNNIEKIVDDIVTTINQYNLDGINVDIENVTHIERDKYTLLVKRLREKLPDNKEVSVAVAANPYGWSSGWHGSYDYGALAQWADYLFIMAYDEHYEGGAEGPVASIEFVEKSIQYALEYCPSEKLVLGLPFFGRIWSEANGGISGLGASNNRLENIISATDGEVTFNEEYMSPVAKFTIKNGDNIKISGKELAPGKYTAWFENSDSIKTKLSLVDKYALKGAGSWSLGQETKDVWDYYYTWLNGKYFTDIITHFAKDDIQNVAAIGLMQGTGKHTFSPYKSITRAEMAVIGARLLNLKAQDGFVPPDCENHWAENEISAVYEKGIMNGYPDGNFYPDKEVTREEAAVFLARAIDIDDSKGSEAFVDIDKTRWSYDEIISLVGAGILNGYPDKTFRPERIIDRGEMAALLGRATN